MWLYFSVIVVSYLFVVLSFRTNNKIFSLILSCVAVLIPSLIAGYRDETVGMDLMYYAVPCFNSMQNIQNVSQLLVYIGFSDLEPLYLIYNFIITRFTDDFFWPLFIQQVMVLSLVLFTCYRFRYALNAPALYLLFMLLCYCQSMSLNRQIFAISILFFSFYYVVNRKLVKFLICIAFATLFHSSGIIGAPIYFIYGLLCRLKEKNTNKFLLMVGVLGFFFFIFFPLIITTLINWDLLDARFVRYIDNSYGTHKIDILIVSLLWCVTFMGCRNLNYIRTIRAFIIIVLFFYLCGVYNDVATRAGLYYLLFTIIINGMLIKSSLKKGKVMLHLVVSLFIIQFLYLSLTTDFAEALPYTSKELGIKVN